MSLVWSIGSTTSLIALALIFISLFTFKVGFSPTFSCAKVRGNSSGTKAKASGSTVEKDQVSTR